MRLRPCSVCLPLVCPPPWNWHNWVLLVFSAGRPHWSLVRDDCAVHRAQRMLPPAVDKKSWGLVIAITQLSQSNCPKTPEGRYVVPKLKLLMAMKHAKRDPTGVMLMRRLRALEAVGNHFRFMRGIRTRGPKPTEVPEAYLELQLKMLNRYVKFV